MSVEISPTVLALRERLAASGIPESELAFVAGVHPTQLSRYFNGHRDPRLRTLKRLEQGLTLLESTR